MERTSPPSTLRTLGASCLGFLVTLAVAYVLGRYVVGWTSTHAFGFGVAVGIGVVVSVNITFRQRRS